MKKRRVTLDLTQPVHTRLVRLVEKTGAGSYAQVFREALATYELIANEHLDGSEILIRTKSGAEQRIALTI